MKIIAILLFVTTIGLLSCQEPDAQTQKEEFKNLLTTYYDVMSKKDLQKMNELTTANFVFYDEGVIYNNASAAKSIEGMDFTATFKFDSLNAYIDKADASVYYLREATFTIKDSTYPPVKFLESATFRKDGKKWKIRFLHSSIRK